MFIHVINFNRLNQQKLTLDEFYLTASSKIPIVEWIVRFFKFNHKMNLNKLLFFFQAKLSASN